MAQRVERRMASRNVQENADVGVGMKQRTKAKEIVQRCAHPRTALGNIVNNARRLNASKRSVSFNALGKVVPSKKTATLNNVVEEQENKDKIGPCQFNKPGSKESPTDIDIGEEVNMEDVIDIDADDHHNPFACAEYAEEIYVYLKKRETEYQVPANYMQFQKEINERMRGILVDWLVDVHDKFKLAQETLFLAISIMDRYLAATKKAKKTDLQLIGVTAMLLASKIEEIYSPDISDLVYITDNTYSSSMILSLEAKMSSILDFNFGDPLCIQFLRRNSKALKVDAEKHTLAKYFMELMLPDYQSIGFPPSERAAAALCLALKITDDSPWNATVTYYSKYTEASLEPCMKRIAQLVLESRRKPSKLVSVTNKYSRDKFCNIAASPCLSSAYIVELPEEK